MKAVKFEVTTSLIKDLLYIPRAARIVSVNGEKAYQGTILLIVESPELPELKEGDEIPMVLPNVTVKKEEWNWNLPVPPEIMKS